MSRSDRWRRALRSVPVFGLTLVALACASAQKRFEQGLELEEQGRYPEAAFYYADALRREPALEAARARLRETGPRAIADLLARSDAAAAAGRAHDAADEFIRIDRLLRESAEVGVTLAPPGGYASRRRLAFDRAIDAALDGGGAAIGRGQFGDAIATFGRAIERYDPAPAQHARLRQATVDAWLLWADAEAASGRYRAAFDRAQQALEVSGIGGADAARARELQAMALARGTRHVAALPVEATASADRTIPADLVSALDDELVLAHWSEPPPFVAMLGGAALRQALRQMGYARRTLSTREIAALGREVDADYVVAAQVDSAWSEDTNVRSSRRAARTRAGADTAYTLEEGRRRLGVRVTFALVDAGGRRVVEEGHVVSTAHAAFRRATFNGNPTTLDLPRGERDIFDQSADAETEQVLSEELVADLAPRFAGAVYERVLRRIE